jgi:GH18 family chitinase
MVLRVCALVVLGWTSHASAQSCRVVGYYPWWASDVSSIEYEWLTNVLYFALDVTAAGDLVDTNINYSELYAVRDRVHAAGGRMGICVGGWLTNDGFSPMAADPVARAHFIDHVKDFCLDHHLDGVDLDWEPVESAADQDNYSLLLRELSEVMRPLGKDTSVAVSAGSENIHAWVAGYVDWVAIMAYDMGYPHSSMDDATWALSRWRDTFGFPAEKLVLGVPFYGRNASNTSWTYASIVATWNPVPAQNWTGKDWDIFFNGRNLVNTKAQYVLDNGFDGMMIWALGYDAPGEASLLQEIDGVFSWCIGDLNGDCTVDGGDLGALLGSWGTPLADLNSDATTNGADLGLLMAAWGPCS